MISMGTQFTKRGDKQKKVYTVVDRWVTTNQAGEVVQVRYVAEHEFCGQTVTARDIVATTIKMGLI